MSTVAIAVFRAPVGFVFAHLWIRAKDKSAVVGVVPDDADARTISIAVLRGMLDFLQHTCFFFVCSKLPVAFATTIHFLFPIWAMFLGWYFLDEPLGPCRVLMAGLAVVGVLITSVPTYLQSSHSFAALHAPTLLVALVGGWCQAGQHVTGRVLSSKRIHFLYSWVAYALAAVLIVVLLPQVGSGVGRETIRWKVRSRLYRSRTLQQHIQN